MANQTKFARACGALLHPTALPGPYGVGTLGANARAFVEFLERAGQTLWQVCPLGPTGYGDSPYQCFSAFAGNPLLIDLDTLVEEGLLRAEDLADAPLFPPTRVDYGPLIEWKFGILRRAAERLAEAPQDLRAAFDEFRDEHEDWLEDYALFMALKDAHAGRPWTEWPTDLAKYKAKATREARAEHADAIDFHALLQFLFFRQWTALREYANARGVRIIGDIPIFVAHDSADAWSNQKMFSLEKDGSPKVVAGVPPDYFSETGQRWGNPLYKWSTLARSNYRWWIDRMRMNLTLYDMARLDHFRGFAGYWEVPAAESNAINGQWVKGPGAKLFDTLATALGEDMPIIAEDLGEITPDVVELREKYGFPGMKVLQFAFDEDSTNEFLPHNHVPNSVVYTGTHDNDTTTGWYWSASEKTRDYCRQYLWIDGHNIAGDLIHAAYASVSSLAIVPFADYLALGPEARFNHPGKAEGNWSWRAMEHYFSDQLAAHLRSQAEIYGRFPVALDEELS